MMLGGAWPGFVVRCVVIRMSAHADGGVGCVGERGVRGFCCVAYVGTCANFPILFRASIYEDLLTR